ncbi:LuxR family transcriptional regulator [Pseudonocardia sp. KRD-184]|uniref:LuxR family transcriptional regulator n=1 Tax=Pseudonocardia oceani TaxID=2792013 RepID=A0ABS6UA88_9PSEU|nr:helix-turn-helix transcriptional regulator [Pseudonocardia oceani]MBW0088814.1 LuxR family transcriptional regulator [Pseudonocardia oceani]MBW0097514.1 LuxR family transcriptional regulator [Pseudonocardia oceani]MBW0110122.1 LuxR family transcriptional regulator [Pseudonocardia oceani]MBW0122352.1 LuxR family transcriptional regulator [Pseudonocardia oceani]MBW0129157.1 LuxR family transcriptional regulator [Pseudonocardia oceani]
MASEGDASGLLTSAHPSSATRSGGDRAADGRRRGPGRDRRYARLRPAGDQRRGRRTLNASTLADGAEVALRDVASDPVTTRRIDVVGPGGYGKTAVLTALAATWAAAGVPVRRDAPEPGEPLDPGTALVVDDAHLLPDDRLRHLTALAAGDTGRIVIAHRPHPESRAMAALGAELSRHGRPVVLDVLDRGALAVRAQRLLGHVPDPAVLDTVLLRSAGIPALVDLLLELPGTGELPADLLAQLGYALEELSPGVRELLLARAIGAPRDAEVLVPLLGLPGADALDELVVAAWAEGRLLADGGAVPLVSAAVLARTPPAAAIEVRRALAEIELERGGDVLTAARGLLRAGGTGKRVAAVFAAAADQAVRTGAGPADELYEAAIRAGAAPLELAPRRAEAAVIAGRLDLALDHADRVLDAVDGPDGAVSDAAARRAGAVAAAVLARRGNLARSAELYRWTTSLGAAPALAVPALVGTGALDEARAALAAPSAPGRRPPTLRSGAEELTAQGVLESVVGAPTGAMSKLVRAAGLMEPPNRAALLTDTPAALAALVAVQCGELAVAQSVLERAERVGLGGCGAAVRHRLLLGWIAMYRGEKAAARAALDVGTRLEPRDELLAAALEVALARRASDPAALMVGWARAREAIVHHPVDLFVLQPLSELRVAAARLREQSWVEPHLDEAAALLARLGNPLLWAAPLHWAGVHAAMFAQNPDAAAPDVAALQAGSSTSRYAAAMAVGARQWLLVLRGEVDPAAVESAARGLHAVGLSWDGGRLAGQAAIRTRDKTGMASLLGTARALQVVEQAPEQAPSDPASTQQAPARDDVLSDREREVAALVLEGLTYKQIGEQLFISAKTVEHHVSRMRQRLGSGSRGELFAHLRGIIGT